MASGSRLSEETVSKPKPMVEIGGDPILWHIMKHYAHYGFNDFVVALGYKGEVIKRYFTQYAALAGDITVSTTSGVVERDRARDLEDWTVHLVDTGLATRRPAAGCAGSRHLLDGTFMMTFGDGVSDVDLDRLVAFHRSHGRLATITAVRPPARFGHVELEGDVVARVLREAADRRGLDQRRLHRPRAARSSTTSTATRRTSRRSPWSASPPTAS